MLDLKRLRYFLAVANESSFTRAAEKLNMAQPPLSRRIHELEEELGTNLFQRDVRPLALTSAGKLFYEQSIQIVQKLDQLSVTMRHHLGMERQRFAIGLVPSGFHERLPDVLRKFRLLTPDVELSLLEMTSLEQVEALKNGRIDAGLGRIRVDDPGIDRVILRDEVMLVALPPGQALVGHGPVELADLTSMPLIVYPAALKPSYADHILSLFRDAGVELPQIIEVRELQTALVLVAAGMGACIIPASSRLLAHAEVLFRPLTSRATSPIILIHRRGDEGASLRDLLRTFAELYTEWGYTVSATLRERTALATANRSVTSPV